MDKTIKETVTLTVEETQQVSGGFRFGGYNLASRLQPSIGVYAQVAASSLKPVASSFSALKPVSSVYF